MENKGKSKKVIFTKKSIDRGRSSAGGEREEGAGKRTRRYRATGAIGGSLRRTDDKSRKRGGREVIHKISASNTAVRTRVS